MSKQTKPFAHGQTKYSSYSVSGNDWQHQSVAKVLQQDGLLQALSKHSSYLLRLQSKLLEVLTQAGAAGMEVSVARYQSGILKLHFKNQGAASRFRFLETQLIALLRKTSEFSNLNKLVVRVARHS